MDEGRWHLCAWHCQHTCKGAGCLGGCLGALVGGLAGLCLPEGVCCGRTCVGADIAKCGRLHASWCVHVGLLPCHGQDAVAGELMSAARQHTAMLENSGGCFAGDRGRLNHLRRCCQVGHFHRNLLRSLPSTPTQSRSVCCAVMVPCTITVEQSPGSRIRQWPARPRPACNLFTSCVKSSCKMRFAW